MNTVRAVSRKDGLAVDIEAGPHRLTADADVASGGAASAPEPHELLAAALAACGTMTLKVYAKRKGWALETADVSVSVEAGPEGTVLRKTITLTGPLSPEERARLAQVADRCPVHKTLAGSVKILTTPLPDD